MSTIVSCLSTTSSIAIMTALRGAGGFGKTTLAVAICHDDDILAAFDDGILWVTLGEKPDVTGILTMLYAAIVGDVQASPARKTLPTT